MGNKKMINLISLSGMMLGLSIIIAIVGPKFGIFGATFESVAGYVLAIINPLAGAIVAITGYVALQLINGGFMFGIHHIPVALFIGSSVYLFGTLFNYDNKLKALAIPVAITVNMAGLSTLLISKSLRGTAIGFAPWLLSATAIAVGVSVVIGTVLGTTIKQQRDKVKW